MGYLVLFSGIFIGIFIGFFLSSELRTEISKDWAAWIAALSTLVIALLTIVLSMETWGLRKIQTKQIEIMRKNAITPLVNLKLEISQVDRIFINLLVENNGVGIAKNIRFKVIMVSLEDDTGASELSDKFKKIGFIKNGISSLGINEVRETFLFIFPNFTEKFGDKFYNSHVDIEISYQDIDGNDYKNSASFRMNEYIEIGTLGGPAPLYQIAKNTEAMSKFLKNLT